MNEFSMNSEQKCALALGIIFTFIGIAGFIPALVNLPTEGMGSSVPLDASSIPISGGPDYMAAYLRGFGYLFGLFPTNLLHNMVHLAIGGFGLFSATGKEGAFRYNRFFAISYLLLAVMGLIPLSNTLFGIMPIFGNNVWFNAVTGAIAAYFAFVWHPSHPESTAPSTQ
ncbi:DUF4383 domain-containing protein [Nodosilinea sp. LEGE 06152]|uniref:DUF4383 domain-containing protein n=1 Tax=Nodosilinea sp. LEGE 06152 TaxID=2777966 RepID=UPI001D1329F0|nr:DUF4383 domain-containing protein [Nodosilinea sp. LEGE 06152]